MVLTILSRIGDIYSPHVPHNAGVTDERVPTRDHAPGPHTHTSRSTATYAAESSRSDACLPCTVRRAGPDAARRGSAARPVSCCATCKICVLATWHSHAPRPPRPRPQCRASCLCAAVAPFVLSAPHTCTVAVNTTRYTNTAEIFRALSRLPCANSTNPYRLTDVSFLLRCEQ